MQRRPKIVFFYVTEVCDAGCRHCCYPPSTGRELDLDEVKVVLDRIREFGIRSVSFVVGEPLERGDIVDIVRHCRDIGLTPHVAKGRLCCELGGQVR